VEGQRAQDDEEMHAIGGGGEGSGVVQSPGIEEDVPPPYAFPRRQW
jgi:hypothetical protein